MDNVRNFYEEETQYEKATLEIKELIKKIVTIDIEMFRKKIESVDKENQYSEFIDLFNAITGKKTNKYYFSKNSEDAKYSDLELNKVYKMEDVNADIQSRNKEEKILDLQARSQLAEKLIDLIYPLRDLFNASLNKGDGVLSTINSEIIIEADVEYLEDLLRYLGLIIDKTGRLKILVSEQEIYKKLNELDKYNKKSSIGKWFYNTFNKEKK